MLPGDIGSEIVSVEVVPEFPITLYPVLGDIVSKWFCIKFGYYPLDILSSLNHMSST